MKNSWGENNVIWVEASVKLKIKRVLNNCKVCKNTLTHAYAHAQIHAHTRSRTRRMRTYTHTRAPELDGCAHTHAHRKRKKETQQQHTVMVKAYSLRPVHTRTPERAHVRAHTHEKNKENNYSIIINNKTKSLRSEAH